MKTKLEVTDVELAIILAALEAASTKLPGESAFLPQTYQLRDKINAAMDGNTFLVSERVRSLIY